nr:MAG TPA: hypothetical protein [Bacteriophage sp.]
MFWLFLSRHHLRPLFALLFTPFSTFSFFAYLFSSFFRQCVSGMICILIYIISKFSISRMIIINIFLFYF